MITLKVKEQDLSKGGQPTKYNQNNADFMLSHIAKGMSVKSICKLEDCPIGISNFYQWLLMHEGFQEAYVQAKEEGATAMAEQLQDIAQDAIDHITYEDSRKSGPLVMAYKLMADNLKWSMSKIAPKKYGDKVDHTTNGKDLPISIFGDKQLK